MRVIWEDIAWEDYLSWQRDNIRILRKVNKLIEDIKRHPFDGIGKPEPLKENLSGCWSRRITGKERIVYYKEKDQIIIMSCRGHYNK